MIIRLLMIVSLNLLLAAPAFSQGQWRGLLGPPRDNPDEAQPLRPPTPSYPIEAAERGLPGHCDVQFDVDEHGVPENILPRCTHPSFCESARTAMRDVRFRPRLENGVPVARPNVVYPLTYMIDGGPQPDTNPAFLRRCDLGAIS